MTEIRAFDYEDRLERARLPLQQRATDGTLPILNEDEIKSSKEILSGYTLPGSSTKVDVSTTDNVIQTGLNSGIGITNNQAIAGSRSSIVMNMQDASNYQRLRAAGLMTAQINERNIYLALGTDSQGNHKYGFYSKGFGEGDERSGVISISKDGQLGNLGTTGWSRASEEDIRIMKTALQAREQIINAYGSFDKFKEAEELRAKLGDLLGTNKLTNDERKQLTDLSSKLSPNSNNIQQGLSEAQAGFAALGSKHKLDGILLGIKVDEARGRIDSQTLASLESQLKTNDNIEEIAKALDTALDQESSKKQLLDGSKQQQLQLARDKFQDNLIDIDLSKLDDSTRSKIQTFLASREAIHNLGDAGQLTELNWQNHRFEQLMKNNDFKTAIEVSKKPDTVDISLPPILTTSTPAKLSTEEIPPASDDGKTNSPHILEASPIVIAKASTEASHNLAQVTKAPETTSQAGSILTKRAVMQDKFPESITTSIPRKISQLSLDISTRAMTNISVVSLNGEGVDNSAFMSAVDESIRGLLDENILQDLFAANGHNLRIAVLDTKQAPDAEKLEQLLGGSFTSIDELHKYLDYFTAAGDRFKMDGFYMNSKNGPFIVLPKREERSTVNIGVLAHEIGHAVDERIVERSRKDRNLARKLAHQGFRIGDNDECLSYSMDFIVLHQNALLPYQQEQNSSSAKQSSAVASAKDMTGLKYYDDADPKEFTGKATAAGSGETFAKSFELIIRADQLSQTQKSSQGYNNFNRVFAEYNRRVKQILDIAYPQE